MPGLARLGPALWLDPEVSERALLEGVTAVLLARSVRGDPPAAGTRNQGAERILEALLGALLERARREESSLAARAAALSHPVFSAFYRLAPEERAVLVGLHRNRWSYRRLSAALGVGPERLQEIAWAARLCLVYSPEGAGVSPAFGSHSAALLHPGGAATGGACPELHPARPWVQRFLDEECSGQERLFLETHCRACQGCARALARARALRHAADRLLPLEDEGTPGFRDRVDALRGLLEGLLDGLPGFRDRSRLGSGRAVLIFLQRSETQLVLGISVLVTMLGLLGR
jgi:hypothetical protein